MGGYVFHKCQGVQRRWVSWVVIPRRKAVDVPGGFTLWSLAVGAGFYEYIFKLPPLVACLFSFFETGFHVAQTGLKFAR